MTIHKLDRSETKVRRPRAEETELICKVIVSEVPKLPHYQGVRVDPEWVKLTIQLGLDNDDTFMMRMLVDKDDKIVGGVCGYCVTQFLSSDKMTGDVFLYIMPEWRSLNNVTKLMLAYRDWAIALGATIVAATQTGGYKQDQLGALLERFGGYQPVGTIYYYRNLKGSSPKDELAKLAAQE